MMHKNFSVLVMSTVSAFCVFAASSGTAQQNQESALELTEQTAKEFINVHLQVEPLMRDNPAGSSVHCTVSISNNVAESIAVLLAHLCGAFF
ncbi:MAG: hypothetical protein FWG50_11990 [Kiritimatiellaeota bacterium]|nr:hypothetical protein [Kiritimatiellota bacterium]